MYVVFNIDHIHHLLNEPKMLIFSYNSVQSVYVMLLWGMYQNMNDMIKKFRTHAWYDKIILSRLVSCAYQSHSRVIVYLVYIIS